MLDAVDREIIRQLVRDGRQSHRELGQLVGLSPNATGVRVNKLIADGVITGIHAHVDHACLGRPIEAMVDCWRERGGGSRADFEAYIAVDDRVLDAVHLTGKVDYRLHVVVESPAELNDLLGSLREHAGIGETDTRLILERY